MAGRPSPRHPSLSQLTSQLETIPSCYPENAPHQIPTTFRTAPTVGEEGKLAVEGRTVKWTIVEILRDNSLKVAAFTVKVDETREM
jgi:hypothetical protein